MGTSRKYLLNVGEAVSYGIGSIGNYKQYNLLDSFTYGAETTTTTVAPITTTTVAPITTTTTTRYVPPIITTTTTATPVNYYVDYNDDIFTDYNGSSFIE